MTDTVIVAIISLLGTLLGSRGNAACKVPDRAIRKEGREAQLYCRKNIYFRGKSESSKS